MSFNKSSSTFNIFPNFNPSREMTVIRKPLIQKHSNFSLKGQTIIDENFEIIHEAKRTPYIWI
ncbi:Hypothetical Protein SiL_1703 [Sulfolobus islandicus LAL14/1]|jgi:hypothetical protein|uniref:Uncharacterized protein n=4 Tax=Saccharolobus islandicus TaxID=43080 RepID=M9U824_SACIS|nr:Hypothetical Protein SiL_1703 [Sulfolobus islandicus LAL14/1]